VLLALLAAVAILVYLHPAIPSIVLRTAMARLYGARTGTVGVRGTTIAWTELGAGRPIVMVHGLGGESAALIPLARRLATRGYRSVMIDLPGCGRSPVLAGRPLELDEAGRLALDAAASRNVGPRPALLGHSLGGWIVAWQALERPERCGPLILTAAAGMNFDPPPLNVLMPRTVADGRRNQALLFADPPYIPTPVLWAAVRRPRPANFDLLRSAMSGRFLLDGLLPGLTVPALVVAGAMDRIVPPSSSRAMAAQIPASHYVEIPETGHMLIWERPAETAAAIDVFLREHTEAR
jgi:pimeloyl-ACP methyl ester carboxylesterase